MLATLAGIYRALSSG